jgi:hypothetical protein
MKKSFQQKLKKFGFSPKERKKVDILIPIRVYILKYVPFKEKKRKI